VTEQWQEHARAEIAPKVASSAYIVTLAPDQIDPKIALETGYAVLLDKPIVVVAEPGRPVLPGLRRIATEVIELTEPFTSDAGQQELMGRLAAFNVRIRP
jgi:hypothetical protein